MDARDFQALAQNLLTATVAPEPARMRTVISRAYYAAHLLARSFVEGLDSDFRMPKRKDAHEEVPRHLHCSDDPMLVQAGDLLNGLRTKRTDAD